MTEAGHTAVALKEPRFAPNPLSIYELLPKLFRSGGAPYQRWWGWGKSLVSFCEGEDAPGRRCLEKSWGMVLR